MAGCFQRLLTHYRGGAALRRHCVAPHGVDFGNHRDGQLLRSFGCRDSRPKSSTAATNDYNIMSKHFELYYMLIR